MAALIPATQRNDDELATHREQLTLELAILSEQKSAKIIELLEKLRHADPAQSDHIDREAEAMTRPADPEAVLDAIKTTHVKAPERPRRTAPLVAILIAELGSVTTWRFQVFGFALPANIGGATLRRNFVHLLAGSVCLVSGCALAPVPRPVQTSTFGPGEFASTTSPPIPYFNQGRNAPLQTLNSLPARPGAATGISGPF